MNPEDHGVCHRMRTPEDIRRRPPYGTQGYSPTAVKELVVISQPWGHTPYHFIVECLPKLMILTEELAAYPDLKIHVPLSLDTLQSAEGAMIEEYLSVLGIDSSRLVFGEVYFAERVYWVTPTRCVIPPTTLALIAREEIRQRVKRLDDWEELEDLEEEERFAIQVLEQSLRYRAKEPVILLVQRSGRTRRLSQDVDKMIRSAVLDIGGRLIEYDAGLGLSPRTVLRLFGCADAVIAPHGAGLANLISSRPGVHVLEFHPSSPSHESSGMPGLNLCALHLSRVLGLHYTGALMHPVRETEGTTGAADSGGGEATAWTVEESVVETWLRSLNAVGSGSVPVGS
mmetsp:Transcript_48628/g.75906  ORF Transcript_48628/g.75906 Transcript_48628/m.75906 type:complete len:342 (+) Transcript_48628:154-1179(+)